MPSLDPFEDTQPDSASPSGQSQPSSSRSPSHVSTIAGTLVSLAAMSAIFIAWMTDKIQVWWHATLALLIATLPTSALADLAKTALRLAAKRFQSSGK